MHTCMSRVADHSPSLPAAPAPAPPLLAALPAATLPRGTAPSLIPALMLPGICDSILVRLPVKVRTS